MTMTAEPTPVESTTANPSRLSPATAVVPVPERTHRRLDLLMCRPRHFEVSYAINPWMRPDVPVDTGRAVAQWEGLRAAYRAAGHRVRLVDQVPGLPDMVYVANAGLVHGDRALVARFAHAQRHGETDAFARWFAAAGLETSIAAAVNEGEGDFLRIGNRFLAGTGFRSTRAAHREVADFFGVDVVSLELVDPRFYHLDTALFVLDAQTVAYYPGAFSQASQEWLASEFPAAVVATKADALAFGLNAVCDGQHVFLTAAAPDLPAALDARGWSPVPVELDELLKGGGSLKCCTLELHAPFTTTEPAIGED